MPVTAFSNDILTIAGGTGFVGTHIIRAAALAGLRIRVLTRYPQRAYICKTSGVVGQIVAVKVDYNDKAALQQALAGSRYVLNCIGELSENRKNRFSKIHTDYARNLAEAAANVGAERFVQISALGCDRNASRYSASKLAAEKAVLAAFPAATILRPSIIFGSEDSFINRLAQLISILPFVPLVSGGKTLMQPVYVSDVAQAVMVCLQTPAIGGYDVRGQVYALGGPEVMSFAEIMRDVARQIGVKAAFISLPTAVARMQALFLQFFPPPLQLTNDQITSLQSDNIVLPDEQGFAALGIYPTAMSLVTPSYLQAYQRGGRFKQMREEQKI